MTERLYYSDAYLTEFDARVISCEPSGEHYRVRLDRSAFYPTSGGQPYDTGTIADARVIDVMVDDDHDVTHVTDRALPVGATVHGRIDWPRRFDHMQQHAADHMIASALWRHMGGVTIGLHVSSDVSTIDVAMPEGKTHLTEHEIRLIEDDVNARIRRDVPVRCWFPDPERLAALPLRKPPTVSEHVRIVAIGDDEMVACGGTHPSTAGQIGLVKIVGAAPARGKMRLSFLAGARAYEDYREKYDCAQAAAALMSTAVQNLPERVAALQADLKQVTFELTKLKRERVMEALTNMLATAPVLPCGAKPIVKILNGDIELVREAASKLIKNDGVVALLGCDTGDGKGAFVFARSADVDLHMGRLLKDAATALGGKGGGRPDFAQGGGPIDMLTVAARMLTEGQ